jgi:hypothetical protein
MVNFFLFLSISSARIFQLFKIARLIFELVRSCNPGTGWYTLRGIVQLSRILRSKGTKTFRILALMVCKDWRRATKCDQINKFNYPQSSCSDLVFFRPTDLRTSTKTLLGDFHEFNLILSTTFMSCPLILRPFKIS